MPRKKELLAEAGININLADAAEAIKRLAASGTLMNKAMEDAAKILKVYADAAMEKAREAAGPFAGGVKDQREGRPVFEGFLTVCAKCFGLKRLDDCTWGINTSLTEIERIRVNRLGIILMDVPVGTCKSCVGIDRDPLVSRAIDLEGDNGLTVPLTLDVSSIERSAQRLEDMTGKAPIGVAMTGGKTGDTITVQLNTGDMRSSIDWTRIQEESVFEVANETNAPWVLEETTIRRRPIMVNTGAREERYERLPRRERPPYPGKKTDTANDVTKTRARQIVLDED